MEALDANDDSSESAPLFLNVLLMHEDVPTCLRAWHVVDLLARNLEEKQVATAFGANVWKFESLGLTPMRERALAEAGAVDMFVLAAHGQKELPGHVKSWLEQWFLQQGTRDCAMVISLDKCEAESPLRFVKALAADTNIQIFPHWGDAALGPWDWHLDPVPSHAASPATFADGFCPHLPTKGSEKRSHP